jgi:hypothetical protein
MTKEEVVEMFENDDDNEYLNFDAVQNKKSARPDLHAFILLDTLVPGKSDMVAGAEHDEIYLDVALDAIAPLLTPELILELRRCGVRVDDDEDGLAMFA